MANPRQRRKARSSTHSAVSHSQRAKRKLRKVPPIRGPKALRDAWDKHKTVRQNYAALGLMHRLDPLASGGVEPVESKTRVVVRSGEEEEDGEVKIPEGFGKIVRDGEGNVVRVEMGEDEGEEAALAEDVGMLGGVRRKWVTNLGEDGRALEHEREDTADTPKSQRRHASAGERAYMLRLVAVHGGDVEKMAVDRRLNWEQRSVGELKSGLGRFNS